MNCGMPTPFGGLSDEDRAKNTLREIERQQNEEEYQKERRKSELRDEEYFRYKKWKVKSDQYQKEVRQDNKRRVKCNSDLESIAIQKALIKHGYGKKWLCHCKECGPPKLKPDARYFCFDAYDKYVIQNEEDYYYYISIWNRGEKRPELNLEEFFEEYNKVISCEENCNNCYDNLRTCEAKFYSK